MHLTMQPGVAEKKVGKRKNKSNVTAEPYPRIKYNQLIVDNTTMQLVSRPQQFVVMVTNEKINFLKLCEYLTRLCLIYTATSLTTSLLV